MWLVSSETYAAFLASGMAPSTFTRRHYPNEGLFRAPKSIPIPTCRKVKKKGFQWRRPQPQIVGISSSIFILRYDCLVFLFLGHDITLHRRGHFHIHSSRSVFWMAAQNFSSELRSFTYTSWPNWKWNPTVLLMGVQIRKTIIFRNKNDTLTVFGWEHPVTVYNRQKKIQKLLLIPLL